MLFISIFIICITTNRINGADDDGRGASAHSTEVSVGCFSSDSVILLNNGAQKQIGHVRTGDEILTVDQMKVVPSEMFIMLDKEPSKQALFYTFTTETDHRISLTGFHLIPIRNLNGTFNYIPAKDVQYGDELYIIINNQVEYSSIRNITIELKTGYFAPLTMTGTIIMNGVFASCYASVKDHDLAQIFMTPFRWYYRMNRLISVVDPFDNNQTNGIHWLIKIIYEFITLIRPSTFQLS